LKYRKFGKLDWDVSALGFGAMRLPVIGGDTKNIDQPEAIKMIRHSIDHGVNYVDTANPYNGGESEKVVGKASTMWTQRTLTTGANRRKSWARP